MPSDKVEFHESGQWTWPIPTKESKNWIENPIYQSILWQILQFASQEKEFREYCVPKPLLLIEWWVRHDKRKLLLWYFRDWDEDQVKFWFFDGDYAYDDSKNVRDPKRYDQALDFGGISSIDDYSNEKLQSLVRAYDTNEIADLESLIIQAIEKRKSEIGTPKDLVKVLQQ